MRIRIDKSQVGWRGLIADCLMRVINDSRFTLDSTWRHRDPLEYEGDATIKLSNIRLRVAKPYCGNHAGPCVVGRPGRHRRARYLEGADWVEFNDLINDTLDHLNVSARVWTSVCVIREGRDRRIDYDSAQGRQGEWDKRGVMANYCGREAPRSTYPAGTPGGEDNHAE